VPTATRFDWFEEFCDGTAVLENVRHHFEQRSSGFKRLLAVVRSRERRN
jgi:hypothetical protein